MTPLRQRMLEDMQLRGLSARTQECYVAAVRQFAEHFHTRPDRLTEEQLRQYFLYLALIRFGGHIPKGGYDVQNGIKQDGKTSAATVHGGIPDRCGAPGGR